MNSFPRVSSEASLDPNDRGLQPCSALVLVVCHSDLQPMLLANQLPYQSPIGSPAGLTISMLPCITSSDLNVDMALIFLLQFSAMR